MNIKTPYQMNLKDMAKQTLMWEKYRPQKLDELILSKENLNVLKDGVKTNFMFIGPPGVGKTTAARVLANKDDHPCLELSAGSDTNAVENLRKEVEEFVTQYSLEHSNQMKVVILDEFERASKPYQVALQSFIESNNTRARFIICANTDVLLNDAIKSRFKKLNFTYDTKEERSTAMMSLFRRLKEISTKENWEYSDKVLGKHIKKYFPDIRRTVEELQYIQESVSLTPVNQIHTLYQMVIDKTKPESVAGLVQEAINPEELFESLGRPFFNYLKKEKQNLYTQFLAPLTIKYAEKAERFKESTDPVISTTALVYEYQNIMSNE